MFDGCDGARKVLVVEDNEANLKLLKKILEHGGFDVLEARNGVEGVVIAGEGMPDLILMDVQMPEMDGITAMKTIKSNIPALKDTPVIAITAYAMKGDRERLISEGFSDYISKPVRVDEILRKVNAHLYTN